MKTSEFRYVTVRKKEVEIMPNDVRLRRWWDGSAAVPELRKKNDITSFFSVNNYNIVHS